MRRKDNQLKLGEAIKSMIKELGMEQKILATQTEELFAEMMGEYIMKRTERLNVENQVLWVKIKTPELRSELSYGKSKIITHINTELKQDFLKDIKFV